MRVPGGGASCLGVGHPGRALSHPRPLVSSGVRPGPTTHWLWVRGVRAWGPVTNSTARALACWLCALWGRHEGARGGRLLPGCGASGDGRSPTPGQPSFRACGRGPLPTRRRCGVRALGPGCPWLLVPYRGSSYVVRASRVPGTRWPLWFGTCPRAVVVAGGVPLWRASWPRVGAPRLVRSGRSRCSSRLSRRRGAFPRPNWVAARGKAGREPGSLCLLLAPAEARALGALRVVPVWGTPMGLSLAGPSGFGLWLRALRWFGVCGPGH